MPPSQDRTAALPAWAEERLSAARRRAEAAGLDDAALLAWARERDAVLRASADEAGPCACSGPSGDLPACPCGMREAIAVNGLWIRAAEGPDGLERTTLSVIGHPPGWNQVEGVRFPRASA